MGENCTERSIEEITKMLEEPFAPDDIEWRVQRTLKVQNQWKAIVVPYVQNRTIQARLDHVFGVMGWENSFKELHKGVICGITAWFNGRSITKWDGADITNIEDTKGAVSNSMKRAAVQWGIGRYLYKCTEEWVPVFDDKKPNSIYIKDDKKNLKGYWLPPQLPSFALPKGFKQKATNGNQQSSGKQTNITKNQNQSSNINNGNQNDRNKANKNNSNSSGFNQNQQSHQQNHNNTQDETKNVLDIIGRTEALIGLNKQPGYIVRIFNRANPNNPIALPIDITKSSIDALREYYKALKPVNDVCSAGRNYGISNERLVYFAQIVKPEVMIDKLFSLFFQLDKDDVGKIIQMAKAEGKEQQRTA
ncbi:Rad52/Rad22 family DNA repair protein [Metabacillus herbersteinensis]|uniref:Rad52/Rad22 family DNA repair protein n=1 Tax=Metabacillus herbersteinensis TaxID=283816 RepID=A0ABV6GJ82_9BACI